MTFVWSHRGERHFRHKQGHTPCILSSLIGTRKARKQHWREFNTVKTALTRLLEPLHDLDRISPLLWETPTMRIFMSPFYCPEQHLLTLKHRSRADGKELLVLVPKIISPREFLNIAKYGNYRVQVRAIYTYAYLHSIPNCLLLTDGVKFYHLTNKRRVWSVKLGGYCKTLFDYDIEEVELYVLLGR